MTAAVVGFVVHSMAANRTTRTPIASWRSCPQSRGRRLERMVVTFWWVYIARLIALSRFSCWFIVSHAFFSSSSSMMASVLRTLDLRAYLLLEPVDLGGHIGRRDAE